MGLFNKFIEKLNPTQRQIAMDEGEQPSTQTKILSIEKAYELVEVVNQCVNLIVDNSAMIDFEIGSSLDFTGSAPGVKPKTLMRLLNTRPNPYMDISTFRRLTLMDFLIDGNAFWYYDGTSLYHLPADMVTIVPDEKTYVHSYRIESTGQEYKPHEVIHFSDNSISSTYRGDSRINSALESLYTRESMIDFQKAFFSSGTSMGLVIETDQVLNKKMKDRQEREWMKKYNPRSGNGRPMILDGGQKAKSITNSNFRELAFNESIDKMELKVATALGIPPILLDSGNNANIKPNIELWFYTRLIPMMRKFEHGLEYFFGMDVELSTFRVPALLPDKKVESDRLTALVNNGIITGNEAREALKMEPMKDSEMDAIRIPQNIAGSGTGVSGQEGGRPQEGDDE